VRALAAALDPIARAALAEALAGNISTHVAYCRRASEPVVPADAMDPAAVPVAREITGPQLAAGIAADGTLGFNFNRLRVSVPVPALAGAILRRIDGVRSVGAIEAELVAAGTDPAKFLAAWAETWTRLSQVNQILLAAPA